MTYKILELYSGIGGMHCAWKESGLPGEIVSAVDINTVANEVYRHNFPNINLLTRNIQSISLKDLQKLNAEVILMSPPCQPFTRNGKNLDNNDRRTDSFLYLLSVLEELESVEYVLMENVKGFERSSVRNTFIEKLEQCQFEYQEFLLCPHTVGVPNKRMRYYCIAKKYKLNWPFKKKNEIIERLPKKYEEPFPLEKILDCKDPERFLVPDKMLKRANVFDICYKDSTRSCCFTKAYSHYIEGTGSIFSPKNQDVVKECLQKANTFEKNSDEFVEPLKSLQLRFFTPNEALSLMSFPKTYEFPNTTTLKQCYRLIGNSINVKVVSELLKILFE